MVLVVQPELPVVAGTQNPRSGAGSVRGSRVVTGAEITMAAVRPA